jgi:hypothetical protein
LTWGQRGLYATTASATSGLEKELKRKLVYRLIKEIKDLNALREVIDKTPSGKGETYSGLDENRLDQAAMQAEHLNESLTGFYFKEIYEDLNELS